MIATDMDKLKYEKQKEKNEWKKEKEEIMNEAMKMWEEDKSFGRATKIQNTIKERMGGNKMTETQKRRFSQFQKDFFMERSYKNDAEMMEFYNANTNDEKKIIWKKIKSNRSDWKKDLEALKRNKIVSNELYKELQK